MQNSVLHSDDNTANLLKFDARLSDSKVKAVIAAFLAALVAIVCCFSLSACSSKSDGYDPDSGQSLYDYNMAQGTVAKNSYDYKNLESFDSREYYVSNSKVVSKVGIDVSSYQGTINWSKVAVNGIDFAYLRAGYRGTTDGGLFTDTSFESNYEGATSAGLEVGAYYFSQALNAAEAHEEASAFISLLNGKDFDLPVVYDLEIAETSNARTADLSYKQVTEATQAFCDDLTKAGYKVMIYLNKESATNLFDLSKMQDYSFWYAEYASQPSLNFDFKMWQYSSSGSVYGIEGSVDMNILFEKK